MSYIVEFFRTLAENHYPKPPEGLSWRVGDDVLSRDNFYAVALVDSTGKVVYNCRLEKKTNNSRRQGVYYIEDVTWPRIRSAILNILEQIEGEKWAESRIAKGQSYLKGSTDDQAD